MSRRPSSPGRADPLLPTPGCPSTSTPDWQAGLSFPAAPPGQTPAFCAQSRPSPLPGAHAAGARPPSARGERSLEPVPAGARRREFTVHAITLPVPLNQKARSWTPAGNSSFSRKRRRRSGRTTPARCPSYPGQCRRGLRGHPVQERAARQSGERLLQQGQHPHPLHSSIFRAATV